MELNAEVENEIERRKAFWVSVDWEGGGEDAGSACKGALFMIPSLSVIIADV